MMSVTGKIFMSNGTLTAKRLGNWTQLNKQLVQGQNLAASDEPYRRRHRGCPDHRTRQTRQTQQTAHPLAQVKKELQLE